MTASDEGEILMWDIPTSRVKERFNTNITWMQDVIFGPNDEDLIVLSEDSYITIHRRVNTNSDGFANNIFSDPKDSLYVNSYVQSKSRNLEEEQQYVKKFRLDETKPIAISDTFVAGQFSDKLRIVNLRTGEVKDLPIPDDLFAIHALAFYKPGVLVTEGAYNTILFINVSEGKIIKRLGKQRPAYAKGIERILFNEGGDTLVTVANQKIQLWDLRKAEKILDINPARQASQSHALDFRKGNLSFIVQSNNLFLAAVANLRTGSTKMIAYADTTFYHKSKDVEAVISLGNGIPLHLKLSPDARTLLVLRFSQSDKGKDTFIDWWDLSTMSLLRTVAMTNLELPCWQVSWDLQKIAVWDYNGMSLQEQKQVNDHHRQFGLEAARAHTGIYIVDFKSGKIDDIDLGKVGVRRLGETSIRFMNSTELHILDTYDQTLKQIEIKKKIAKATIDLSSYGFHERVGKFFSIAENELIYSVHPWGDGDMHQFRKWNLTSKQVVAQSNSRATPITALSDAHPSGIFALGLNDNTISIRSNADLTEKYRIVQDDDGHSIFITPDNFYKADRTSAAALHFSWNDKSFALSQFDRWFNRPDKVLAATGLSRPSDVEMLEKAYTKRAKKAGANGLREFLREGAPLVSISNMESLPLQTKQDSVRIDVGLSLPGKSPVTMQALVNGVLVKKVFISQPVKPGSHYQVWVPLVSGQNNISIKVEDSQGTSSLPANVQIELESDNVKPDLYVLVIAIDRYLNSDLNLHYAVKDARDIARFFKNDQRFSNVFVDSLFNQSVTANHVLGLQQKLKGAKRNDMVIVFFAGHGLLDENLDFRFGTWNVDVNNPGKTGILYEDIEKILDGIKPINKLLLIDACHSGSIDKDEISETAKRLIRERYGDERAIVKEQTFGKIEHNVFKSGKIDRESFELMQDVFMAEGSATGTQVVAATAGDRYAIESKDWQNGFFTYAFLSGLQSGRADQNNDRRITVDEIIRYVKDEVKRMSEGKQIPRLRAENPENYFELWRY